MLLEDATSIDHLTIKYCIIICIISYLTEHLIVFRTNLLFFHLIDF